MVIAGHGIYPSVLAPAVSIGEGEAAIYALHGDGFVLLGRVSPDEWVSLDSSAGAVSGAGDLSEVAERVLSSVVSVEVRPGEHSGSGFRVAVEGMVVTNAHIVGDVDEVFVVLRDGTRHPARVLGRAPDVDIAVLVLADDSGLPPMHSGAGLANARVGDQVLAVGASLGGANNVTAGFVTGLDRPVWLGNAELAALQTDAPLNPGHSGGLLVNARGEVLGVITTIARPSGGSGSSGIGLAIPVDVAKRAALQIMQNG